MIKKIIWKLFCRLFKDRIRIFEAREFIPHDEVVRATTLEQYHRVVEDLLRNKILDEMVRQKFIEIQKTTNNSTMSDEFFVRIITIKKGL